MLISKSAQQISKSTTLAISAQAKEMQSKGISLISFTAGEPDCNTPDYIIESAKVALDGGKTKYTPSSGTVALRKAIAEKLKRDNDLDYKPSQIIVSNGGKHALFNALYAIIDEGDEVIIPTPYWLTYPELVKMCGGKSVFIETNIESDYKITPEQLKGAITDKTKAFIFNSPSNPTGTVYTKEEIYALAEVLEDSNVITISDEIYEKLTYGVKHVSIATFSEKMKEKTIVCNGFSKTYAMTGWRAGYLACCDEIADAIDGVQSHMTSNINSITQEACVTALASEKEVQELQKSYEERRDFIYDAVNKIDGISTNKPEGAFYLFIKVSEQYGKKYKGEEIDGSIKFCLKLLDAGVAAIPGEPFGADDYIRLSFALTMEHIAEGISRLEKFVKELN